VIPEGVGLPGVVDLELVRRALDAQRDPVELEFGARKAAVATVLRQGAEGAEVLLIERARNDSDPWSGHMAFPGGRHDPADPDLLHTALRETREEVGLELDEHAELLGRLDPLPAIAHGRHVGITIAPYVFALAHDVGLTPNEEVQAVLWAPITPMMRGEVATTHVWQLGDQRFEMPAYGVQGRIVWGLTYRMLQALFEQLELALNPR
jgi:8-oxo-dGTP pyrophosphatase MutT (NUDIX family)